MSPACPRWRRAYDALEATVTPRLEALTRTGQFATAIGLALRVQSVARRRTEWVTRGALHALNLPAASDATRILGEIGRLQRDVSRLSQQVRTLEAGE